MVNPQHHGHTGATPLRFTPPLIQQADNAPKAPNGHRARWKKWAGAIPMRRYEQD